MPPPPDASRHRMKEPSLTPWGLPPPPSSSQGLCMQSALNQCALAGYVAGWGRARAPVSAAGRPPAVSTGNSLEVLGVLCDGHVDDVQGVLVVLLGREKERQQVEGIGIIPAHFQGLLQLLHGAGDLPEKTAGLATFSKAQRPPRIPGLVPASEGTADSSETLGLGCSALTRTHGPKYCGERALPAQVRLGDKEAGSWRSTEDLGGCGGSKEASLVPVCRARGGLSAPVRAGMEASTQTPPPAQRPTLARVQLWGRGWGVGK